MTSEAVSGTLVSDRAALRAPADFAIVGIGGGVEENVLGRVRYLDGIAEARPVVEGTAQVRGRPGTFAENVSVLGVDLLQPLPGVTGTREQRVGPYTPIGAPLDSVRAINHSGAVLSARLARALSLKRGASFDALARDRVMRLEVADVLPLTALGVDSSVLFVDFSTAQTLFDERRVFDRIDCVVAGPSEPVLAHVAALLPPGDRIDSAASEHGELGRLIAGLERDLTSFSIIASLVAGVLLYNAIGSSVNRRRSDVGVLRALGATREAVFRTFLMEGALFGLYGSALGCALGLTLPSFAVEHWLGNDVAAGPIEVPFDLGLIGRAFGLGVVLSVAAAVLPAWNAIRTAPAMAARAKGFEAPQPRPRFRVVAIFVGVLVAVAIVFERAQPQALVYIGEAAALCAGALAVPSLLRALSKVAIDVTSRMPAAAQLAARNLGAAPQRVGLAVTALAVALGATIGFSIEAASFRAVLTGWVNAGMGADIVVRSAGWERGAQRKPLAASIAARVRGVAGVTQINASRSLALPFRGQMITVRGEDRAEGEPGDLRSAIVTAPLAARFNLQRGDVLELPTKTKPLDVVVTEIAQDFTDPGGVVRIDRNLLARAYGERQPDELAILTGRANDPALVRSRLLRALGGIPVEVRSTRELRNQTLVLFERTFVLMRVLGAVALALALAAVAGALGTLVFERRHEIGLLRFLGAQRTTIGWMIVLESGLLGALCCAFGVSIGAVLAAIALGVIDRMTFGWPIPILFPAGDILLALLLTFGASIAASAYPARIASRIASDAARAMP